MRRLLFIFFLLFAITVKAQVYNGDFSEKKIAVSDTILIDSVSINPFKFKVYNTQEKLLDSTAYQVDFSKSYLILNDSLRKENDSIKIVYRNYPDFFTKRYYQFDPDIIVGNENRVNRIYQLGEENNQSSFVPFDGLTTSGSISRGITVGTNQNAVLDSELRKKLEHKSGRCRSSSDRFLLCLLHQKSTRAFPWSHSKS